MAFEPGPPPPDPDAIQPEVSPTNQRGCWMVGISAVVILSLLASSLAALFWVIGQRTAETAVAPDPVPAVEPTPAGELALEPTTAAPTTEAPAAVDTAVDGDARINRIVFVNSDRQIATVAPDGSSPQTLTEGRRIYQFPAWSPDSSRIAAIGLSGSGSGIFLLDDGAVQDPSPLYFSADDNRSPFYLYWSPDSRKISFLANNPNERIGLNLVDAAEGAISRLIATGSPFYWNWTADASQMLIHSGDHSQDARLVMIDEAGLDSTPPIDAPGLFQAPGISANGRYWAYSQLRSGATAWLVVDDMAGDASAGQLFEERHAGPAALSWSPTANQLAYISGGDDSSTFWGPLRLLDADTGAARVLSSELVLAFFWSPDGRSIATISAPRVNDLGGIDALLPDADKPQRASKGRQQDGQFDLNLTVLDVATGQGLQVATFTPSPLFLRQFLPFFDQYALSHSLWSPDSSALVLPIVEGRERKIVVVSASGGPMREIGQGDVAFWSTR